MFTYKVRRKSDGKYARNGHTRRLDGRGWGVGQTYSDKAFGDVKRLYNSIGGCSYDYVKDANDRYNRVAIPLSYVELELVKFGSGGEVVVWTGSKCTMTNEEAKAIIPAGVGEPTRLQRQAGIREEIGSILDEIDAAEEALETNNVSGLDKLEATVELKKTKLQAALEELNMRYDEYRVKIRAKLSI